MKASLETAGSTAQMASRRKSNQQHETWPGDPYPLGASWDGQGVNFALFSRGASAVELCLFDEAGSERARLKLPERNNEIWHGYLPGLSPGQRYGYRVHGPYEPEHGLRFNPNKLLLDPYAKAINGNLQWHDALFGYLIGDDAKDLSFNDQDSAPYTPKAVVVDPTYDWEGDTPPNIPFHKSVIYEAHVRGLTERHPELPQALRGTYAGMAHPVIIDYLQQLGVTAVELMPVHHFISQRHLVEKGLCNYWGYDTIGFFAPHAAYASRGSAGQQVAEFKDMVKALHRGGIEVILDVVYNHTAEGNQMGPTLSFRGIDNAAYYRLVDDRRYYMDYTGTGNTLNMMEPHVLQLIMDSLRYWITEMHVDGFRFDLAAALARELHDVDQLGAFFDIIHQDPIISQAKLIAEPWDVGEGGYMVGKFPPGWAEWNGKYRDCVRDYWRGEPGTLSEFAYRFTGSSDLYSVSGRQPTASVNFVTAHDGFTLTDLVSYNHKRNEANQEGNRDGEAHNRSWNCGAEGPTDDPQVLRLRARQQRNFLATLMLSQGVPMLLFGDEAGRTQHGNNNPYCQDNGISWFDWRDVDARLLAFTRKLIRLRREHPVFRQRRWFNEFAVPGMDEEEIAWFTPEGEEMTEENWETGYARSLAIFLNGEGIQSRDRQGRRIVDDSFLLLFNAHDGPLAFAVPAGVGSGSWVKVLDTAEASAAPLMASVPPLMERAPSRVLSSSPVTVVPPPLPAPAPPAEATAPAAANGQAAAQHAENGQLPDDAAVEAGDVVTLVGHSLVVLRDAG
ncbi:MAG: glycogen debranching protein GlgX [Candidatus Promineifilaceae bacterium]|nr:glycogen debranching protein GlgX [Candidatus Promineifilaceae bacterium]